MVRRIGGIIRPETAAEYETRQIDPARIKAHVEEIAAQEGVEVPKTVMVSVATDYLRPNVWAIRWDADVGD